VLDWYQIFLICTLVLWAFSSPRDKTALRIVLLATLFSEVIVDEVTCQFTGAWKLVFPGMVETLTILSLLKWSRNRTGIMQAGLLVIAWFAHVLCYVDLVIQTDFVYSQYENIMLAVAVGQLIAFYDTPRYNFTRFCDYFSSALGVSGVPFRTSGHRVALSLGAINHKASQVESCRPASKQSVK